MGYLGFDETKLLTSVTPFLQSTTVSLEVEVEDENDNPPQFTESVYQVAISENATVASTIIRVFADDPDHGGNGDIVFTLMGGDGIFAINETSGELRPHPLVNISKS